MAIASWLPQIFLALRRLLQLLKSFKGLISRALRRIFARLAFIWSVLRTNLGFRRRGIGKSPSSSQDGECRTSNARKVTTQSNHAKQGEVSRFEPESISYTLIEQGKKISLDDVALSAYPFPGNIRATRSHSLGSLHRSAHNLATTVNNSSRSSPRRRSEDSTYHSGNLNDSNRAYPFPSNIRATRSTDSLANSFRSVQNLATTVDNASRSSQHLESEHSYHSANSNYSGSVYSHGRTTAAPYLPQPSRDISGWQKTTPTRHRKPTMSTPNLEVISPIDDMSPTGNGEVDSLWVPTRSITPVFMPLDEPRISPRMPEDFSDRRYDERPRM